MNKPWSALKEKKRELYDTIQRALMHKAFQTFVLVFIILAIGSVILSSFHESDAHKTLLYTITHLASFVFLIEYILRLFAAPARYPQSSPFKARMRYMLSFYGFVDFVAILPFVLVHLYWNTPLTHMIVLLPYIFIIFKLIRYSHSFQLIGRVLGAIKNELITAYTACGIIIGFSAILMYYIERDAQPKVFSNIGQGFWWAIETFTTVGYGDIYPVTPLGKILGSLMSLVGIGMIAIPTGLISSSFITIIQQNRRKAAAQSKSGQKYVAQEKDPKSIAQRPENSRNGSKTARPGKTSSPSAYPKPQAPTPKLPKASGSPRRKASTSTP